MPMVKDFNCLSFGVWWCKSVEPPNPNPSNFFWLNTLSSSYARAKNMRLLKKFVMAVLSHLRRLLLFVMFSLTETIPRSLIRRSPAFAIPLPIHHAFANGWATSCGWNCRSWHTFAFNIFLRPVFLGANVFHSYCVLWPHTPLENASGRSVIALLWPGSCGNSGTSSRFYFVCRRFC